MQENEEILQDLPYTVIGGSGFPVPKRRICFTGKGIKAIAEKASDEDTVVYEAWKDCSDECDKVKHYSRWSVIKHAENKTQAVPKEQSTNKGLNIKLNSGFGSWRTK